MSKQRPWVRAMELLGQYRERSKASRRGGDVSAARLKVQADRVAQIVSKLAKPHSLILGDPVGTGKTAVALTAARVLMEQSGVEYVMVVAPNEPVAEQWQLRATWLDFQLGERWNRQKLRVVTRRSLPEKGSSDPAATLAPNA